MAIALGKTRNHVRVVRAQMLRARAAGRTDKSYVKPTPEQRAAKRAAKDAAEFAAANAKKNAERADADRQQREAAEAATDELIHDMGSAMCRSAWAREHGSEELSDAAIDALPTWQRSSLINDEHQHEMHGRGDVEAEREAEREAARQAETKRRATISRAHQH